MYIEKLTKLDFDKFASIYNSTVAEHQQSTDDKNEIYLKLFTGAMGPQPEMWLSDFNLRTSTYYKFAEQELKTDYIKFMYKKFGKKYQEDYTKNYNDQMEEGRII